MKVIKIYLAGCILCALQSYISMYEYKGELSSTCLKCTYIGDVLLGTLFFNSFFFLAYLLLLLLYSFFSTKKLKDKYKIILYIGIYTASCFTVNYEIFISRISSWSTFTTLEEIIGVIRKSYVPILITLILFYLITKIILMHKRISSG